MIEMENAQMRADLELQNSNPDATTEMTVEWGTQIGGGGVDAPIETISQNGTQLPISNKNVNIDAYTTSQVDTKISEINLALSSQADAIQDNSSDITSLKSRMSTAEGNITSLGNSVGNHTTAIGNLETSVQSLGGRVTTAENKLASYSIENFTVRYNPKFDLFHRPTQNDRAPLLLNRSSIEVVNGKRFFNIDIIYNNFIPASATSQGFEQGEILFLLPRMAGTNYTNYNSLLDSQFSPLHTPTELYQANQYYVVGWINRISELNTSIGNNVAICCQISNLGEVINNTNNFFKSTTATLDKVYHISGRYEIASDWTMEEYENYVFQIS